MVAPYRLPTPNPNRIDLSPPPFGEQRLRLKFEVTLRKTRRHQPQAQTDTQSTQTSGQPEISDDKSGFSSLLGHLGFSFTTVDGCETHFAPPVFDDFTVNTNNRYGFIPMVSMVSFHGAMSGLRHHP